MSSSAVLEACHAHLRKQGFARSNVIASQLDLTVADVEAQLAHLVAAGELVTCDLQLGEDRVHATEYRASTLAGGQLIAFKPGRPPAREPDPVKARLAEWRVPRTPSAPEPLAGTERPERRGSDEQHRRSVHAAPTAAPAAEPQGGEVTMTTDQKAIAIAFEKHGPMKIKQLRAHVALDNLGYLLARGCEARPQLFARLAGKTSGTIWGLPTQEAPKPDALERGAELGRRSDKPPRHLHARKAKKGRKRRVKRTSQIPVNGAAKRRLFQVALCNDGALIFLNARAGDLDLTRDECRGLVKAARHLEATELGDVLDFVRRLDKAEVAA